MQQKCSSNRLLKDIMRLKTMEALYKRAQQVVKYVKGKKVASATYLLKQIWGSEALAPEASIILQIPPSSAASESNWSLFGNTHTKVRNRLTNVRVEKLVAIRGKHKALLNSHNSHNSHG